MLPNYDLIVDTMPCKTIVESIILLCVLVQAIGANMLSITRYVELSIHESHEIGLVHS